MTLLTITLLNLPNRLIAVQEEFIVPVIAIHTHRRSGATRQFAVTSTALFIL